ncbi:MAG: hypothetical protein R3E13_04990 [Alphaproteobacteria bacterium]
MQRYTSTILICLIPFFIAVAHDIYLFFVNTEKGFMLSTLGYSWTHYSLDSYKGFVTASNPADMALVNSILSQKSVVVTFVGGFGLFVLAGLEYLFLKSAFGWLGNSKTTYSTDAGKESFRSGSKSKKMQYTRK